jgi:hypothetical protein
MDKTLRILSIVGIGILSTYLALIGWYQAIQIRDFLPQWHDGHASHCLPGDLGNLCTIYGDRFGAIAMGVIVSLFFYPSVLTYFASKPKHVNQQTLFLSSALVLTLILIIHFSGLILYLTAD